jgi:toxic protein SymE
MKKTRKLKIQPKIILRSYDKTIVPEILLKGKWLEEAGFKPGQNVQIEQKKNKLTITIIE